MKFHPERMAIISALFLLAACGGGGGNPGTCSGSDEVCERPPGTGNSTVPPVTVAPSTPPTTSTTATTTATTPTFAPAPPQ